MEICSGCEKTPGEQIGSQVSKKQVVLYVLSQIRASWWQRDEISQNISFTPLLRDFSPLFPNSFLSFPLDCPYHLTSIGHISGLVRLVPVRSHSGQFRIRYSGARLSDLATFSHQGKSVKGGTGVIFFYPVIVIFQTGKRLCCPTNLSAYCKLRTHGRDVTVRTDVRAKLVSHVKMMKMNI